MHYISKHNSISEMRENYTVRNTFMDCSNFITNFSKPLDEGSGWFPLSPPFSGELFGWNDSSTAIFSSFSCRTVAWILCGYLWWILKKRNAKLSQRKGSAAKVRIKLSNELMENYKSSNWISFQNLRESKNRW